MRCTVELLRRQESPSLLLPPILLSPAAVRVLLRAPLAVDVPELELAVAVGNREGAAAAGTEPVLLPPNIAPVL